MLYKLSNKVVKDMFPLNMLVSINNIGFICFGRHKQCYIYMTRFCVSLPNKLCCILVRQRALSEPSTGNDLQIQGFIATETDVDI